MHREFLKEVSDPSSPGAKPKHESDPTVPTLSQHRPLIQAARRLLEEVCILCSEHTHVIMKVS